MNAGHPLFFDEAAQVLEAARPWPDAAHRHLQELGEVLVPDRLVADQQ